MRDLSDTILVVFKLELFILWIKIFDEKSKFDASFSLFQFEFFNKNVINNIKFKKQKNKNVIKNIKQKS